ncbi:MAG: class I SAM-dependent methyltransferase [Acidobacteria bacterium]|nr:class I SAM-dependent methyltransferase [Acidobacteriota bacterium]
MTSRAHACRICQSPDHDLVLDYGEVVPADAFLSSIDAAAHEQRYPLTLVLCQRCFHLQILEVLDPALLFVNYVWETGIPASIQRYCREFADAVLARSGGPASPSVFEIASNDGTMLKEFRSRGCRLLGVDPARNIARKANSAGIPTIPDFFGERVARDVLTEHGQWDVVIARNVLAHVADVHGLIAGLRLLLTPQGTAVIEVPHLLDLYRELQYDQVFHEHIGYHSLDSIIRLCAMHDLVVFDVEHPWVHGGSVRAYVGHAAADRRALPTVAGMLAEEETAGILGRQAWQQFGDRARTQKRLLRAELSSLREAGKMVVGYGAAAKGMSMIQFCELDDQLVAYVADKSTMKIGKFAPGAHIPIVSPDRMRADPVDVVVVFAWNFAREILAQEKAMRDRGVRFLHPIPEPHYL